MARRDGAHVIAVVRRADQLATAQRLGAHHSFLADDPNLSRHVRQVAPNGVHRIADVDFGAHVDFDADILAVGGAISSYSSSTDRPSIPYWALGFKDITLRHLGSDDFTPDSQGRSRRSTLRSAYHRRPPLRHRCAKPTRIHRRGTRTPRTRRTRRILIDLTRSR